MVCTLGTRPFSISIIDHVNSKHKGVCAYAKELHFFHPLPLALFAYRCTHLKGEKKLRKSVIL